MDALIRSPKIAPFPTRLSEARCRDTEPAVVQTLTHAQLRELRAQVEQEVRDELRAQFQSQYETERTRSRTEGLAAATEQANAAAAEQLAKTREELQAAAAGVLSTLQHAHHLGLSRLQSSSGEIAFAALCRVVGKRAGEREFVLSMVDNICAEVRAETIATVRLHPRDIELLEELLPQQRLSLRSLQLTVVADKSLQLGGCVIESAAGQYDGALEGQLRRLHTVLSGTDAQCVSD